MADLMRSGGGPPSRRSREQRAYRLAVAGGTAGVVTAIGLVLAIVGAIGLGVPILAGIVAAVCAFLFRQTVSGR